MRAFFTLPVLAAVVAAAPRPQDIDFDQVEQAADPVLVTPPVDVASQVVSVAAVTEQAAAATSAVFADPASNDDSSSTKRDLAARDESPCAKQPKGYGPVASSDTVEAFLAQEKLSTMSTAASAPYGYTEVFKNKQASLSASMYMGLYTLTSYDVPKCQSLCDAASACVAFNMYAERDPTLKPDDKQCPNPASLTNYKCTLWGAPVSAEQATNFGETRASFKVVITASNAYNKNSNPASISGFTGPTGYGGAINAPLLNGKDTFMGSKFFPFSQDQGLTMESCTSACTAQTAYNTAHPNKDGTFKSCAFVNGYVLSKNGVPQGLYCSMYTNEWAASYATNYGQYRGSDRYTVSYSYGYSVVTRPSIPSGQYCPQGYGGRKTCARYSLVANSAALVPSIGSADGLVQDCALQCLANPNCLSWATTNNRVGSYPEPTGHCTFYSQSTRDIADKYQVRNWDYYQSYAPLFDYDCFDAQGAACFGLSR